MRNNLVDPEDEFPGNPLVRKILNTLKPVLIFGLKKALSSLPSSSIVKREEDCNSSEMKRQYRAMVRARQRWETEHGIKYTNDPKDRTNECLDVMQQTYFTIQKHEANYQILSALILDEYIKIRNSGEKID